MALPAPVELVKLVIMFESADIIDEEGTGEFCKLSNEKGGGIAIEVEGSFQEVFKLIKEKVQEQALALPAPVESDKLEKLVVFVSVDVIESEGIAEVSKLFKEMVGAIAFEEEGIAEAFKLIKAKVGASPD